MHEKEHNFQGTHNQLTVPYILRKRAVISNSKIHQPVALELLHGSSSPLTV